MSEKVAGARKLFEEGFSCSQAVFTPYAVEAGLEKEEALKLSQVLGGGMSHMGLTCGAVTGALLVIGLHFGRTRAEDRAAKELTYELAQKFCRQFTEKFGSINCTDLLGCSLKTPRGLELASQNNLFEKYCSGYVEEAGRLLEQILREGRKRQRKGPSAKIIRNRRK
ncbi:MAG: C-GCAxxG-C-C family protein [Candidatus Saccharicenans sp.]|nr:C-GCAxxG-C-C family protein [Candidatus Saccharicenans sp.]